MSKTRRLYLTQTSAAILLAGGLGGWAYFTKFPHHYFSTYPVIPVYFLLLSVLTSGIVDWGRKHMKKSLLQVYLLVRIVRMVLSFTVMALTGVIVREEVKSFLLTFIVYYLIYLIYYSFFFYTYEGNKNLQKIEQNETIA